MQVAEGVYKVDGPRVSNAYLIVEDEGLTLVDTGLRGNASHVLRMIERLGRRPAELRWIVLTHSHIDHIGSAAALRRLTGAAIAIHGLDEPVLARQEFPPKGRRAIALIVRLLRLRPVRPDRLLSEGDRIGGFVVLHVPGHTEGSIALVRDDGVVFSGDALLGDRHGAIRPPDPNLSVDPALATASAERIRALPLTLLLPGHGAAARVRSVPAVRPVPPAEDAAARS